jgi:hypothetical protein
VHGALAPEVKRQVTEEDSMNQQNGGIAILILIVMGLTSAMVSFMGIMMLGMGEACCHLNDPGGMAYAGFAWTIALTLAVFLLYAAWPSAKPIIFWIWAGMIVSFFTAMNIRTPHHGSPELHLGQMIRGLLAWPLTWAVAGFIALSHIEARFGIRTWGNRSVQGA